jgi:hypothetical protein
MPRRVKPASRGAPRWTYAIGAIVGVAGLFWTITSYFLSHSRSPEQVSSGYSPTQQGWAYRQAISIGVVEAFLANVKGRKIPQDEWPRAFAELTQQCLQMRGSEHDSVNAMSAEVRSAEHKGVDGRSFAFSGIRQNLTIPAQDLHIALFELSAQSGASVLSTGRSIAHQRSSAVKGSLTPGAAIKAMLAGTGLRCKYIGHNAVEVFRKRPDSHPAAKDKTSTHEVPTSRARPNSVPDPDGLHQFAGNGECTPVQGYRAA